ncbi:MAG: hypothetical protein II916_07880 [Oscillospiraceae bacterium]|nr:hypothetical protein [Oscillospiraceae bacterium]
MKQRMVAAIVLFSVTLVALVVFIGLYADERMRVQETYQNRYEDNLERVREDIVSYQEAEGDYELRYQRLMIDMSNAKEFAFLIHNFDDKQIIVNELYTVLLKYPEQMQTKENLDALYVATGDILAHLDKGYDEAEELVESIDKKGH